MEGEYSTIPWNEEQWNTVQETIREEARKVRIAASFLPIYGPLPSDTEWVPLQEVKPESTAEPSQLVDLSQFLEDTSNKPDPLPALRTILRNLSEEVRKVEHSASRRRGEANERVLVDSTKTRPLTKISVNVYLSTAQIHQPDLSDALIMFRGAANLISRIEDRIVFGGQPSHPTPEALGIKRPIFRISGGEEFRGLMASARNQIEERKNEDGTITKIETGTERLGGRPSGQELVRAVANAISTLERSGHLSPFALVLGSELFGRAHDPSSSLVLPADRIKPMLDGPLLRSSTIDENQGVLVSLASHLVDLVVAKEISAKFLQTTVEPRYVFRVSERMTLRIKQPSAIVALVP